MLELIRDLGAQQGRQPDPVVAPAARRRIHLRPRRRDRQGRRSRRRARSTSSRARPAACSRCASRATCRPFIDALPGRRHGVPRDRRGRHARVRARAAPARPATISAASASWRAQAGVQVRHLRPSVPTLEDVFAQRGGRDDEPDSRSELSPLRRRQARRRAAPGRSSPAPASARMLAQARVPRPAARSPGSRSSSARSRSTSVTNYPQAAHVLAPTREMFREFLEQQGFFVFFITIYVGAGLIANDRRANALQIYLSKPLLRIGVHRRQAGGARRVPAARHAGCRRCCCSCCRSCSPAASPSSSNNLFLFPAITLAALLQALRRVVHDAGAVVAVEEQPLRRASSTPASSSSPRRSTACLRSSPASTRVAWISITANLDAGHRRRSSGRRRATRRRWPCRCSCSSAWSSLSISVLERRVRGVEVVT